MQQRKPSETAPARISPLATLPLFFTLEGKPALVAGGSDAAAWKAELLAAAGAEVIIVAPQLGTAMQQLIAREDLMHLPRVWTARDFDGKALAIADVEAAAPFYNAALSAGVPVNVIDQPKYCQFQFGSIVNRSPVVIGISTAGAAPILGQAIRRRIETLLPASLAAWADAAQGFRNRLAAAVPDAKSRRAIWERFSDWSFSKPAPTDPKALLSALIAGQASQNGKVTLVGAGPGDADLLTLKAVRALQSADVILFDDLVSDDVLELARREAKRMLVGKRGGRASCRQEDINALMLKLARQGKHVVRLKSGDPMVFGRAGEEIEMLEQAGIAVQVVPGITSALAAAAAARISLTHRDHAQSVRFVTGHGCQGDLPKLDWQGLADGKTTLMVYMGGRLASKFCQKLINSGLDPQTPVQFFRDLGRQEQSITHSRLNIVAQNGAGQMTSPLLMGIGSVFRKSQAISDRHTAAGASLFRGSCFKPLWASNLPKAP